VKEQEPQEVVVQEPEPEAPVKHEEIFENFYKNNAVSFLRMQIEQFIKEMMDKKFCEI
jgi:hypothetical protein